MSGHSKWSQIKHKKSLADAKKSQIFSKITRLISVAAKNGTDPNSNIKLREAIERAREINMPKENIERAINKSSQEKLEELTIECWAPHGIALIIEAITDNRNRTIAEIKHLLSINNAKISGEGSVKWLFDVKNGEYKAKSYITLPTEQKLELEKLFEALDENDDVKEVYSNLSF